MYPCADGATPLPGICGWRHILRTANFVDVAQEAIELGFLQHSHPTKEDKGEGRARCRRRLKALTRRFAAAKGQDPPGGLLEGCGGEGENQGLQAGLWMYGESPEGLYTSTLHRLLPLSSVSMGGNSLSRPGGNLGGLCRDRILALGIL